ncbi:MAG: hypothetical protein HC922_03755 [Leptolyngbyaceae cyanobacterium SM2_3_12]|nr:hypothetical protein [Leptolyngbyaceae cyanobacterium SM2_3_12]
MANCGDRANCWRTPTNNWRAARGSLQAQLEAQGYILTDVTSAVLGIDTGVQVYTVTRPGEEDYYLSLVSVQDGVLYTMAPQPITRDELETLQRL